MIVSTAAETPLMRLTVSADPDEQDGEAGGEEEAVAEPEARRPEQSQPPVDELELGVGPRHQVPALQLLRHEPSSPSSVISS